MKRVCMASIVVIGQFSDVLKYLGKLFFKHVAVSSYLLLFLTGLFSCVTVQVYNELDRPVFHSREEAPQTPEQKDSLSVVTFNIRKAIETSMAASELQRFEKTKNADVFLLQEMDENGVKEIAKRLGLNYLYIPVVYNYSLKKDIGNAILTKGTIECPEKLLLPHAKPLSKSRRIVTIAEVTIRGEKILYNPVS